MDQLEGKTAFITGGASGIGFAMAQAFLAEGMKVAIADVDDDALAEAVDKLRGSNVEVRAYQLDVTDRDRYAAIADQVESDLGHVHVVCNNAGVYHGGAMETAAYEDWDWVMGVNVGGVINGVKNWAGRIKAHGEGGHIVNTASIAGLATSPGLGIYNTSKFAVVGMSEALRDELAESGIGVSVLCPGMVQTKIVDADRNRPESLATDDSAAVEAAAAHKALMENAMNAAIPPEEVAQLVVDGIKANKLYLLPHPELKGATELRLQNLLESFGEPDPGRLRAHEEFISQMVKE